MVGEVVLSNLRLKTSAAHRAEVIQALRALMRSARAEKGFIAGRLSCDLDDAETVNYEERWLAVRDLEDQINSPRFTRLLALMETASEKPTLEFHFVSESRGLDYVAAVRGEQAN